MEAQASKPKKEEQDDGPLQDLSEMDIKLKPVDEDVMNLDSSQNVMKDDTSETEALVEPLCLLIKSEQDLEEISEEAIQEENWDIILTTKDMDSSGCAMKGEEDDAEALMTPLFVPVEAEPYSEGTSEESAMEENFEATQNENIQDSVKSIARYSKAENSIAKTCQRALSPGLNRHVVHSEATNIDDKELSMRSLNYRGDYLEGNFRMSIPSSPCLEEEVAEEYREQGSSNLETCKRRSSSSGENYLRTQVNAKRTKNEMQSSSSGGKFSKQSKKQEEIRKPFSCSICGKCFKRTRDLEDHERIHTGERPFQCTLCNKTCTTKGNLLEHMRVHSEAKSYKCSSCEKAFKSNSNLERHKQVHSGEKPFDCSTCGKAFARKSVLIKHMRLHTGEKPFRCAVCGKAFSFSNSLTIHKRVHTGERPFACNICGSRFTTSSNLSAHRACRHGAASPVSTSNA